MNSNNSYNILPMACHGVVCKYDPLVDVGEVEPGLAVDITDMLRTGVVHSGSVDTDNNNIDDPDNVIGLVRDEFAAIDSMRVIAEYGKKQKKSNSPSKEVVDAAMEAASVAAPAPTNS